ncbi:Asp-tRNA(Asn)/Glu-tRNA(Gln) amidotransferase subunit GatC [Candidatus Hydrogenosomobacter endosymbioticus]|nr:aspartyl/glutamyl-tRNA amidotransferase subunit C [Candidatus Hydrogenosomobacter endosymbioticus]
MVSVKDIERVSELACVELSEDEVARMASDVDGILGMIDQMSDADAAKADFFEGKEMGMRSDVLAEDSDSASCSAVKSCELTEGGTFVVPKFI